MNDEERGLWVNNDEGLYQWWKSTRLPLQRFIRENRAELTAIIRRTLDQEPED